MLRWTLVLRCWPASCAAVWAAAKATVSVACAAAHADFILSSWVIWSMSSASAGGVVHGGESADESGEVVGGQRGLAARDLTDQHVFVYIQLNS